MSERNIKLTIREEGFFVTTHSFIISIGDGGIEIRRAGAPVATRDRSVSCAVGREPDFVDLTLHVEEQP